MTMTIDTTMTPEMVNERLADWIIDARQMMCDHYYREGMLNQVPELYIAGGRKYIKICRRSGVSESVLCFIRAQDGAILKPASWKAPALNFTRGSIFDQKIAFGPYGF